MKRKRTIFLTGLALLVLHFVFVSVYAFPVLAPGNTARRVVRTYMFPLFNQNWNIFAPDPPNVSKKLFYRATFSDSTTSDWIDPGTELLQKLYSNRFWNYGDRYAVYEAMGREMDVHSDSLPFRYVLNDCRERYKTKTIVTIECRRVFVTIPPFHSAEKEISGVKSSFKKDVRANDR